MYSYNVLYTVTKTQYNAKEDETQRMMRDRDRERDRQWIVLYYIDFLITLITFLLNIHCQSHLTL